MNPEEEELRAYLSPAFDRRRLERGPAEVEEELGRLGGDEQRLYRESEAYLYDLTAFAMAGTKAPYLDALRGTVAAGARVLDVGCGIGSDGLRLLAEGYRVEFLDFDNPSTRYLRWRLERRGLVAPVHDLDTGWPAGRFVLAYAFDVLEHVDDPVALLVRMEHCARLVLVNLLKGEKDRAVHRTLPVRALVGRARRHGLVAYRVLHGGRSHLVLYGEGGPVRSWATWASGALRAQLSRKAGARSWR